VVKRGLDIAISAVLLLLSLPVLLLSALIVRVTSPGPALFRQERMGQNFRPFQILKLRTMAHAEAGLAYTLGPDPRITPFGKWLRRTKVDELPQLWNVLRGEMSLVGPRPVLPALTHEFRSDYAVLLQVRPGLTDPASLKYSQEAALFKTVPDPMHFFKSVVTPDKLRLSREYLQVANPITDAVTIAMTVLVCCFPSLGKIYGETPSATDCHPFEELQVSLRVALPRSCSPVNSSIFSYELARLEAGVEDAPHLDTVPWILSQIPSFRSGSASVGIEERRSRL
jgi:lipopolysaccharide/colanic/teichoic acid biosynthesis glycosyltransferase